MRAVPSHKTWERLEAYLPFLMFLAAYAFLLRALNPTFYLDDSPETVTAACLVGIPHPPGYPLHTLLGRLSLWVPLATPAFRLNLFSAALASLTAVGIARLLRVHWGLFTSASYALGALWVAGTTTFPAALGAKGSVYQLTALLLVLLIDAMLSRRYLLAAFLWGLSLGHHWMTMATLTPGLLLLGWARGSREDLAPSQLWRLAACAGVGAAVTLTLPLRAVADPALNWGDPRNLSSLFFNLRRAQYMGAELGWNVFSWLRQGWVFLRVAFLEFPGLMILSVGGFCVGWRRDRKVALALLALWAGLGVSACLYLNLGADRDYLIASYSIPVQVVLLIFAAWAVVGALEKRPGESRDLRRKVFAFLALFAGTLAAFQFIHSRRDRYLYDYDYALDAVKAVPREGMLYCRGDGLVFPVWYFQHVEGLRKDLVAVGVDGLPMEWVRRHLMKDHPGLKVPMPTWNIGNESIPALARSIALDNRNHDLYLSYNRVTDASFPEAQIIPYGLAPRAVLPPDAVAFDEPRADDLWAVMRFRGTDGPVDEFTRANLLKDYAIHRNALGVFYEDLADRMKVGIPGRKPATPEDFQRVYGKCLEHFQWARDYYPTDWEFPFNVGNALYNLGRKAEAGSEYRRASELNPNGVDIYYNWSVAAFESKDYFTAVKLFQKVLDLDPGRQGAKDGLDYLKKIGFLKATDSPTP